MEQKSDNEVKDQRNLSLAYVTGKEVVNGELGSWLVIGSKCNLLTTINAWINMQNENKGAGVPEEQIKFAEKLLEFLTPVKV